MPGPPWRQTTGGPVPLTVVHNSAPSRSRTIVGLGEVNRVTSADVTGVHNRRVDAGARFETAVAHGSYTVVIRQDAQGRGVAGERAVRKGRDRAASRPGHHADHQVGAYPQVAVVPVVLRETRRDRVDDEIWPVSLRVG